MNTLSKKQIEKNANEPLITASFITQLTKLINQTMQSK